MATKVYLKMTVRVLLRGDETTDWAAVQEGLTLSGKIEGDASGEADVEDVTVEEITVEDAK